MLSVIIPDGQEAILTREWCQTQLIGIPHEIITSPSWSDGYEHATGDFVSFIDNDCVLSKNYFYDLLTVFEEKTNYRKLAMVSPAIGVNSWKRKVYGYIVTPTSVMPSAVKSSSSIYLIQIGYIPGSIIRKSALGDLVPKNKDVLLESANLSIYLWNSGKRIAISPGVTYVSTDTGVDLPYHIKWTDPAPAKATIDMWHSESIG